MLIKLQESQIPLQKVIQKQMKKKYLEKDIYPQTFQTIHQINQLNLEQIQFKQIMNHVENITLLVKVYVITVMHIYFLKKI